MEHGLQGDYFVGGTECAMIATVHAELAQFLRVTEPPHPQIDNRLLSA